MFKVENKDIFELENAANILERTNALLSFVQTAFEESSNAVSVHVTSDALFELFIRQNEALDIIRKFINTGVKPEND